MFPVSAVASASSSATGWSPTQTQWNALVSDVSQIQNSLLAPLVQPALSSDNGATYHIVTSAEGMGRIWVVSDPSTSGGTKTVWIDLVRWDDSEGVFFVFNASLYQSLRLNADQQVFIRNGTGTLAERTQYEQSGFLILPGGYAVVRRRNANTSGSTFYDNQPTPSYELIPNSP